MALTVADIAKKAFDGVAAKLSGVICSCSVSRETQGAYDTSAGSYTTTTSSQTGRAVIDQSTPVKDIFPAYAVGPTDTLIWLDGLSSAPKENDTITIGSTVRTVMAVGDVAGAGGFFSVIAR